MGLFSCVVLAGPAQAWYEGADPPADSRRTCAGSLPWTARSARTSARWGGMHEGIDIEGWYETRVRAAQRGVVTHVGWLDDYSGYGLVIKIRHESGIVTMYAHLARAL